MYYKGDRNFKEQNAFGYQIVYKYLENLIMGRDTASFFRKNNYQTVAIYGLGTHYNLGRLFYLDIMKSNILVKYFIDKNLAPQYPDGLDGIPVISLADLPQQEPVDVIIITPVFYCNDIMDDLTASGLDIEKLISITDVIFNL